MQPVENVEADASLVLDFLTLAHELVDFDEVPQFEGHEHAGRVNGAFDYLETALMHASKRRYQLWLGHEAWSELNRHIGDAWGHLSDSCIAYLPRERFWKETAEANAHLKSAIEIAAVAWENIAACAAGLAGGAE